MSSFYLASKSPRRKELLEQLGLTPTVLAFNDHTFRNFAGDEEQLPAEAPEDYVIRTAREKILKALAHIKENGLPPMPVLSADTTVICQGRILGKPDDAQEAAAFLRLMSGTQHEVRTAVFVGTDPLHLHWAVSVSRVYFKHLRKKFKLTCLWLSLMTKQAATAYRDLPAFSLNTLRGLILALWDYPFLKPVHF